jgi:hypothetical protein
MTASCFTTISVPKETVSNCYRNELQVTDYRMYIVASSDITVAYDEGPCRQFSENPELHAHICPLGSSHQAINFVLWGDSHAGAISGALHLAASELGLSGVLLSSHGCQPLSDVYREGSRRCQTFNSKVLAYIRTHPSIDHVFLAGYWRIPFTGQGYDSRNVFIMDDKTTLASAAENPKVFHRCASIVMSG